MRGRSSWAHPWVVCLVWGELLNGEVVVGACLLSPATITAVVSLRLRVETPGGEFWSPVSADATDSS